ncbi:PREDICTED: uncharacterized protein LOC105362683 [Ceratosolen solmsi marchali]|uniref:Uncharacterized protein LOC105362683 n=1 Tax=Ceratosolen solmsi marchali TaxID=326594 RepID=A0AAJ6YI18_9HYME|nr:PREDICTED: uncharacterized protein LOC105362683 [Ceratosolen solmsi marchali]
MKFRTVLFFFIICYVTVNCDLNDCIQICEVGALNESQKSKCIRDCYKGATFGGYLAADVNDCIAFCRREIKEQYVKDCEKGCLFTFAITIRYNRQKNESDCTKQPELKKVKIEPVELD